VLDIDVKDSPTGFDKLEALGFPFAFSTPTVHTPSGGSHGYFAVPDPPIRNTNGQRGRGIGPQLDWRACGGYVIAPSPGSGYEWDPHLGIDTPMLEVPEALLPKETSSHKPGTPPEAVPGLSAYGQAALDGAGRDILAAPHGEQEATLNGRCYWIGQLSAWGEIPRTFALDVLRYAARQLVCYDPSRPWSTLELERKVNTAFAAGMRHPRGPRHG